MIKRSVVDGYVDGRKEQENPELPGRRGFLLGSVSALGGLVVGPPALALPTRRERLLSFYNKHTGETVKTAYWAPQEGYIEQSLREISFILRDHRNDKVKLIDPKLLDQMYALQLELSPRQPIHVISAYRSPETNAMLRRRSRRVAKDSLHMRGKAVDIRMPDRRISELYRTARALQAGGVGYYPRSNFIHLDTGSVRTWR
jgi:uncharacterized protein YcbK (DUF882 family)